MDSAIICIHLRNTQPPISLKINAASLTRNTLVIILTNLLKHDLTVSSNTFYGPFNGDFAAAKTSLVIIISNSSGSSSCCSRSGGSNGSSSDSTSSCGSSSSEMLSWNGKYKSLGAGEYKDPCQCVSLLRKTKIAYYENLDERKASDNKRFWKTIKTVKPSLSEKINARESISLSEIVKL